MREPVEGGEADTSGGVDDVQQLGQVEPGLLARHHDLGRRGQRDAVEEVVEHLGHVARAAAAHVVHVGAERVEQRFYLRQRGFVAADHQGQRALLGSRGAAGDPGVQVAHATWV